MKKILTGILLAALIVSLGTTTAFAVSQPGGQNFVDANNDGICDNCDSTRHFIDANGDGICDNCEGGIRPMDGTGKRAGNGGKEVRGYGYTDADNNGICDNTAKGTGAHLQNGRRHAACYHGELK
ncbi:MAG: hypothetical protein VB111_01660 [Clostridiaceae bacterium]|nr:hypothetical protein [Clostridiaceae bacterium]